MSVFDGYAKRTFSHILDVMGEDAVWHKSTRTQVPGRVLYNDPTEPVQIGSSEAYEYRPTDITVEYYTGTFEGLKKASDSGRPQFITVRGRRYSVVSITSKFDGQTYVANLEPYEN